MPHVAEVMARLWACCFINCNIILISNTCRTVHQRKLTMKRDTDHHLVLRYCVNGLSCVGLWKISPKSSPIFIIFYRLCKCIVILMICLFIAALTSDLYQHSNDLLILTDDGCILAGLSVILFKVLHFQFYTDKVQKLIDFVDQNVKALHAEGDPEYLKIWRWYALVEKITLYGFATIGMFLVLALMFFSPTESGALPIRSWYPFDVTEAPLYQVMFVYQGSVLTVAMISILAMDNMVLTLCTQIFCHFEILKKQFHRTNRVEDPTKLYEINDQISPKSSEKNSKHNNFVQNFSRCIKRHQEMIDFVKDLDQFYSPLMFVQLMTSNALICLTGFQAILVAGQSSDFTKFAIYLSAAFSQLFYWCWYGNELIHQSTSLTEVLWLSSWEFQEITSIKSMITIPLMRAKKPLKLTAGKFYVMSMEAFFTVLSGSYSFFTLLNKMNE